MSGHQLRSQNIAAKRTQPLGLDVPSRRACVNCRQRKVRCDIGDKGVPCTNCSTHSRPGCRSCPNKKQLRQSLRQSAVLAPLRPRQSINAPTTASSSAVATEASSPDEGGEIELGAHVLNDNDARDAELGHRTRAHFIGNDLSNCNYLFRQSSSNVGYDNVFHFNNGQLESSEDWYERHGVSGEALERPDTQLERRLVRAYFDMINPGWPIVDEDLFMTQYRGEDPANPTCLTLLNAIMLVGAHALASHDETMVPLLRVFFQRTKILFDCESWPDRLVYIQVPLLMTWYSDANAWYWIGIATRTAMAIGLHRDTSHSKMMPVYKRVYTRLWWVLFQFDTIASLSAGRPQVINLDDSDVPDLQPCHVENLPGAEIEFVIFHAQLCKIISETTRKGWSLRATPEAKLEAIKTADELLGSLILSIPKRLQLTISCLDLWRAHFYLTYYNFVLLIHRPSPKSRKGSSIEGQEDAILCREATVTIASMFEVLLSKKFISSLWLYSNHVVFTATIHIINEINTNKTLLAAKSRQTLHTFWEVLKELAKYWNYAGGLLKVLEQRASRPRGDRVHAPGEPSLNLQIDGPSFEQPTGVSLTWSNNDNVPPTDSNVDLTNAGFNTYAATDPQNIPIDLLGGSQDPTLNNLFLMDTSAFDFLFSEDIS
ncbi:fungal-specific transcription factor domain-containing protein [Fusarium flagelliforme]|uniref:fungal-specific transcription factor domain-containing protein n=1 Tax=Fusarium flagelliforme TaxID=2675880 RepID=UPI001E8DA32E|nr:fungal-specific transcription factor domain-containing protein [Fusarium flagelliforme]KAH7198942.1 fungal-specific transcription factor domain-containing protein [Fusarium flagelliforme]